MKCFYHGSDLDGECSAAIVKYKFPECELYPINYSDVFPWEIIKDPQELIFMVDFSLQPFDQMVKLHNSCDLIWIDHHKTAIEAEVTSEHGINRSDWRIDGIRLNGKAGCELTWEFIYGPDRPVWVGEVEERKMPKVVYFLGRYDVWDHSDPDVLPFQYGMRLEDSDPNNQEFWKDLFEHDFDTKRIRQRGETILEYEEQTNIKLCKAYAFETILYVFGTPYKAICVNKGLGNSKVFDSVWDKNKYDLMIVFCRLPLPKCQWTVSLYTDKPEIDCGKIATVFGGGGHKNAAGFTCFDLPFEY